MVVVRNGMASAEAEGTRLGGRQQCSTLRLKIIQCCNNHEKNDTKRSAAAAMRQ